MTQLRFATMFQSPELRDIKLPLEIRTADHKLVGLVMTSDSIEVEPGMYVVAARLPGGQEIRRVVDVGTDDLTIDLVPPRLRAAAVEVATFLSSRRAQIADLRAAAEKIDPRLFRAARKALTRGIGLIAGTLRGAVTHHVLPPSPPSAAAVLRGFSGNPLAGAVDPVELQLEEVARGENVVQYRVAPAARTLFLQSLQRGRTAVNLALPISGRAGCLVAVHHEPDRVWVEVHVEHSEAGLLLGYQQSRAGSEEVALAERLLRGKLDDPIAATIGAYSLLRFGHLDRLHDWTANLMEWFPWLPDGAAVHGEHLARLGRHQEALETFVQLAGLPMFSDGVGFVWERIRIYRSLESEFPARLIARANALHDQLAPFIGFINFDRVVTTFTGLDPSRPDAQTVSEVPAGNGVTV